VKSVDGLIFIMLTTIEAIVSFIIRAVKLPIRFTVCKKNGHDWLWLGNGFFGMFAPKYPLKCTKCGN
jgi:hypothetical protein